MLCGIAKDLTKLGGKTVTKLVTSDEQQSRLFKLVSLVSAGGQYRGGTVCVPPSHLCYGLPRVIGRSVTS